MLCISNNSSENPSTILEIQSGTDIQPDPPSSGYRNFHNPIQTKRSSVDNDTQYSVFNVKREVTSTIENEVATRNEEEKSVDIKPSTSKRVLRRLKTSFRML